MKPPRKPHDGASGGGGSRARPLGSGGTSRTAQRVSKPKRGSYSQRLIASSIESARAEHDADEAASRDHQRSRERGRNRGEKARNPADDQRSERREAPATDRGARVGKSAGRFRVKEQRGPQLVDGPNFKGPPLAGFRPSGRMRPQPKPGKPQLQKLPTAPATGRPSEPMRIAKAMARAGLCSRREAERWIEDGRVSVNGKVIDTPAVDVTPRDIVKVDGQPLPAAEPARLWRYHKPKGLVTTHSDPEGRPTVFDNLPPELPRVVSVGRLDFNSEGLLLLTNDGELARHLELPATGWLRRYRVRAYGRLTQADLDPLKEGITVDGVVYGPVEATLDSVQSGNMWLTVGLREGKNREVRKILGALGLEVNRLIRVSFGPFQLLDLEPGAAEHVKRRVLADQLGPELAREFGLDAGSEEAAEETGRKPFVARREPSGQRRYGTSGGPSGERGARSAETWRVRPDRPARAGDHKPGQLERAAEAREDRPRTGKAWTQRPRSDEPRYGGAKGGATSAGRTGAGKWGTSGSDRPAHDRLGRNRSGSDRPTGERPGGGPRKPRPGGWKGRPK